MTENTYISDQFETWRKCRKRYYFKYVRKLNIPESNTNFELGKSVHALANYYLKGFKIDHLTKEMDPEIQLHWDSLKNNPVLSNKCVVSEWGFNSRIADTKYWLSGRIDAVFYDEKTGKYIIVDWKTGQNIPKEPESNYQCMMYLYAFYNARQDLKLDFKQDYISFIFIKTPDGPDSEPVIYSALKESEYKELFLEAITEIENENEYPKSKLCQIKGCGYRNLCS